MKSPRQIISASIFTFITLYFLLGIQQGTIIAFYDYETLQSPGINWLMLITGGILFGILVGGAMAFILSIKNIAGLMVLCGFAYMAPRILLNPQVLGFPNPWMDEGWAQYLLYASSPFCGFCFGMAVGRFWNGWKTGIVFGLAGGLTFTIGWWIFHSAQSFILGQGIDWIFNANTPSVKILVLLYWSVSCVLYGAIVGILWGILLDRLPRMKLIGTSEAV